jgi:hypothetical protein
LQLPPPLQAQLQDSCLCLSSPLQLCAAALIHVNHALLSAPIPVCHPCRQTQTHTQTIRSQATAPASLCVNCSWRRGFTSVWTLPCCYLPAAVAVAAAASASLPWPCWPMPAAAPRRGRPVQQHRTPSWLQWLLPPLLRARPRAPQVCARWSCRAGVRAGGAAGLPLQPPPHQGHRQHPAQTAVEMHNTASSRWSSG